jgi:biotin transport system substrate-specific component
VFTGGSGLEYVLGNTGGYLVGFILAQPVIARLGRLAAESGSSWSRHFGAFGAVVAGHAVIFTLGVVWTKLARDLGAGPDPVSWGMAWVGGCLMFLPGMVLKSGIAGVCGPGLSRLGRRLGW